MFVVVIFISAIAFAQSLGARIIQQSDQSLGSRDLGITPQLERKDTKMLCLEGCPLHGPDAWDVEHLNRSTHVSMRCLRAAISMMNSFYGGNLSQDRISYYVYEECSKDGLPEGDLGHGIGLRGVNAPTILGWALNEASVIRLDGKPDFIDIKQWIDSDHPIMRDNGTDHRITVIDGYDTEGQAVHVIDPLTGTETIIPYDDLDVFVVWVAIGDSITARSDEPTVWMDSDVDGVVDFDEINRFHTDPYNPDTDQDGIDDKTEIRSYTFLSDDSFDSHDVRKPDADGDGLRAELDWDSDNGGCPDGLEDLNHNGRIDPGETDPFDPSDDPFLPVAIFEFHPDSAKTGDAIFFNASESYDPNGIIVSYAWDFGDGNTTTVTEPTVSHTYSSGGNYTAVLNVTDNDGLWNTFSRVIFVYEVNHDLALVDVVPTKSVVCQGYCLRINVTVANQGDVTETFNVTVYWNTTEIDMKEIVLTSGNTTALTFTWNTTGLAEYQNYTISAYAHPVPGEKDTTHNTFIDSLVFMVHIGDVNIDRKVRVDDILAVALKFGTDLGDPDWDPLTDINCDDKVRVDDVLAAALEFGWTITGVTNTDDNTFTNSIVTRARRSI